MLAFERQAVTLPPDYGLAVGDGRTVESTVDDGPDRERVSVPCWWARSSSHGAIIEAPAAVTCTPSEKRTVTPLMVVA